MFAKRSLTGEEFAAFQKEYNKENIDLALPMIERQMDFLGESDEESAPSRSSC